MHTTSARQSRFVSSLIALGVARLASRLPSITGDQAKAVMGEVADDVCLAFGGADVYIPGSLTQRRSERNARIRAQYAENGPDDVEPKCAARSAQLAREHGLSVRQVRTILAPLKAGAGGKPA